MRRWSLRTFFLLIALAALALAWVSYQMRVGQIHDDVGEQLTVLGGKLPSYAFRASRVEVTWQFETPITYQRVRPGSYNHYTSGPTNTIVGNSMVKETPAWMNASGIGPAFQRIRAVRVTYRLTPDEVDTLVGQLARLDQLDTLYLQKYMRNVRATQAQLAYLLSHTKIGTLNASRSQLTAGPFPELRQTSLVELDFSHTWFSDSAIADLPTSMQMLHLQRTAVTDAGLPQFKRLYRLRYLDLTRTPTSRAAIDQLRGDMPWCKIYWTPLPTK